MMSEKWHDAQTNAPGQSAWLRPKIRLYLTGGILHGFGALRHTPPRLCQPHLPAGPALNNGLTQGGFQRRKPPCDGGLVNVERACRLSKASTAHQGKKVFQIIPLHVAAFLQHGSAHFQPTLQIYRDQTA